MKVTKLDEKLNNLDKVVDNNRINAVTEMPPVMSDAYEVSLEHDEDNEKTLKAADALPKDKPFLGASKQPQPKKIEQPKINLDESLFEENVDFDIYDFLDECGGYTDYNQKIEDVMEEFDLDRDTAESYVWDWASGLRPHKKRSSHSKKSKKEELNNSRFNESAFDEDSLETRIYDFLDRDARDASYNEMIDLVADKFEISPNEAEDHVKFYIDNSEAEWHDTADQEEEEDIPIDILKDYVDSIEVEEDDEDFTESLKKSSSLLKESREEDIYDKVYQCIQTVVNQALDNLEEKIQHEVPEYDTNWYDDGDYDDYNKWENSIEDVIETTTDIYMKNYKDPVTADWSDETDVEFDESCNTGKLQEDGRSGSLLRQYDDTDIDEEEIDLWTQVYSSLINKPDEATWKTMHKKDTVILPKKMRYEIINSDADGNIIVYGETEKDLDGGIKVAKHYNLKYDVKPTRDSWRKIHPDQSFSLTIKIPEDKVYSPDDLQ